jgi:succinate dehydrogenase / fumarate reductase flavoprotein subunit
MPSLQATDPTERRLEAEKWCDAFEENTNKFLKSSVCSWKGQEPDLVFEDIDTRLMKPRPRLYGLVGGEVIEEVWKQRSRSKEESAPSKPAATKQLAGSV